MAGRSGPGWTYVPAGRPRRGPFPQDEQEAGGEGGDAEGARRATGTGEGEEPRHDEDGAPRPTRAAATR